MELQKALKCMIQILHFPIYTMFLKEYLEDDLRWVSNYKNQKKKTIYIYIHALTFECGTFFAVSHQELPRTQTAS